MNSQMSMAILEPKDFYTTVNIEVTTIATGLTTLIPMNLTPDMFTTEKIVNALIKQSLYHNSKNGIVSFITKALDSKGLPKYGKTVKMLFPDPDRKTTTKLEKTITGVDGLTDTQRAEMFAKYNTDGTLKATKTTKATK